MTTLTIVTCTAPAARRAVRRLDGLRTDPLPVHDLAIVDWPDGTDRPDAWQARPFGGGAVLSGSFWGLLFAHLFLLPLTHVPGLQPASAQESSSLGHLGLGPEQLAKIRAVTGPGTSTAFLLHDDDHDPGSAAFGAVPHTRTTIRLTTEEQRRLYAGFGERLATPG